MPPPGRALAALLLVLGSSALASEPDLPDLPDLIGPHAREAALHAGEPDAVSDFGDSPTTEAALAQGPATPQLSRRVYGYLPYWSTLGKSFRWDLVSDLVVFSADLKSDGTVSAWHGWPNTALIAAAHAHGVRVHLCATLFNTGAGEIATFLDSAAARQMAVSSLVAAVANAGGDGLNFDFEFVGSSHRGAFTNFVQQTHAALQAAAPGAELTLAMPANTSSTGYDAAALSAATERLLMMEYDYHWSTAPTAGPVAQLTSGGFWSGSVESGVGSFLAVAKASSLAMGVPYYGYDWPTQSSARGAKVVLGSSGTPTRGTVVLASGCPGALAAHGRSWDLDSQTPWASYSSSGVERQVWCDDAQSLTSKYQFVNQKNLAGVMIWALGYDGASTGFWGAIQAEFGAAAGAPDGGISDAGVPDAGPGDAGAAADAGSGDAGSADDDGGATDAGPGDAGSRDAGAGGSADGGSADGGKPSSGAPDAGPALTQSPAVGCTQAGVGPAWTLLAAVLFAARRRKVWHRR